MDSNARCCFPINAKTGEIDPNVIDNIPGLELLKSADMMVILAMDLELPDEQMKHFVEFVESGRPILGFRCSVLAFKYKNNPNSPYARYGLGSKEGGFGGIVLGETWRGHHGHHAVESTRGMVNGPQRGHPILRGVGGDIWGPTDVYQIDRLPEDATVLIHGQVLKGMNPDDAPNYEKPIMPMVWTHTFESPSGKSARVVTSTIGASQDLESEDLRRVVVNGVYWALGLEDKIPEKSNVDYVGDFKAIPFGRNKFTKGVGPQDLALPGASVAINITSVERSKLVGKLETTFGPQVRKSLKAGEQALEGAAAVLHIFLSNAEWKTVDSDKAQC